MKTKITQVKRPKNTSLFSNRVATFSKNVEKLSGEKRKPAEYTIVEIPPVFTDAPQLNSHQKQQYVACSIRQIY